MGPKSSRYLIIHGHFYQPPRENPWLMAIEPQDSAAPFADWNARVNRQSYAPNARSRLLNEAGRIRGLVNNYRYLSFNFGPTLLSWLKSADPATYARIIGADGLAAARCGGHGPALAQVYNHIIMPLAGERDKITQVRWGITDFKARYGRDPRGMWLPETAVDLKTLEIMAKEGIKFTVLSQAQARAVRPLAAGPFKRAAAKTGWLDVSGGRIDPREPYRVFWGGGANDYIDVFFYDGPVSRAIAFENLLSDGPGFLRRVEGAFGEAKEDNAPRLVNLATDGESYGHHFPCGDMALAWLFDRLEAEGGEDPIRLTNYAQYLSMFPPKQEAVLFENSSWSCPHGVERWRSHCGCNTGGGGGRWNQKWRGPLREGLDWLGGRLAEIFEREGSLLLKNPWAARDDYINVPLSDYSVEAKTAFARRHQLGEPGPEGLFRLFGLLEAQLMGLYMFTSCAWFFDDISGLEPVRNLTYASRAIELAKDCAGVDLKAGFLEYIGPVVPNNPEYFNGLDLWRKKVAPGSLGGPALAAHWAAAEILNVPDALALFSAAVFEPGQRMIRLKEGGLEMLAGTVAVSDRRLYGRNAWQILSLYSGGVRLAIWVSPAGAGSNDVSRFAMDDLVPHSLAAILSALGLNGDFMERLLEEMAGAPSPKRLLDEAAALIRLIRRKNFHFDMWRSQNLWHDLIKNPSFMGRLGAEETGVLREIGELLGYARGLSPGR